MDIRVSPLTQITNTNTGTPINADATISIGSAGTCSVPSDFDQPHR